MVNLTKEAKTKAYAPYSKFEVGVVLLGKDGRVFTGANIENASYSLSICAERVALYRAIMEGCKELELIALSPGALSFIMPCGSCLQTLSEFGSDIVVMVSKGEPNEIEKFKLSELLPRAFLLS
ncbi:MAG: cytidine deaminase [Actinomycetota bacterium]|nr:cytidine deaminase [Actinomycetota bacterium]